MSDVVQKLWGFCHTLRHDGIDYGDYIEQITYLLFLKMADERGVAVPEGLRLAHAPDKSGTDLTDHYADVAPHPRQDSPASSATSSPGRCRASTTPSTSSDSSA